MEKFCKNCGCYLRENDIFCPDCGRATENRPAMKYCPNCGEKLETDENFCPVCGMKLKTRVRTENSGKNRNLIIILAVVLAVAAVGIGAFTSLGFGESQDVYVDSMCFTIPYDFDENEDLKLDENDNGAIIKSKFWQNGDDIIQIDVMYSTYYSDAEEIAEDMGGEKTHMMGYNGYYSESDDIYEFTFAENGKIISVFTSDSNLLNQISVN